LLSFRVEANGIKLGIRDSCIGIFEFAEFENWRWRIWTGIVAGAVDFIHAKDRTE
jgi:hypothetical protein